MNMAKRLIFCKTWSISLRCFKFLVVILLLMNLFVTKSEADFSKNMLQEKFHRPKYFHFYEEDETQSEIYDEIPRGECATIVV